MQRGERRVGPVLKRRGGITRATSTGPPARKRKEKSEPSDEHHCFGWSTHIPTLQTSKYQD
jgi:hypothetical protein